MKYTDLLVSVPLWLIAGTAFAQPLCGGTGVPASSLICKPTSSSVAGNRRSFGCASDGAGKHWQQCRSARSGIADNGGRRAIDLFHGSDG